MSEITPGPCADISVLYVEDETATREQVSRVLTSWGYRLIRAENGREGLDCYREHRPDVVLTDIMMPLMNGLEMAHAIRSLSSEIPIICMTAFSDTSYLISAIDIGINQFVLKPVEFDRLKTALTHCQDMVELRRRNHKLEAENQQARKMEAVGILAGGMAHDFNNLLQVILGYVSLARMSAEPGSKTEELLSIAEKSSGIARELGKRLLTLARGGEVHMQQTRIRPLIVDGVAAELRGTSITPVFNLPDNLPPLKIDTGQITQVITQLSINAREAMPQGGTLRVSAESRTLSDLDGLMLEPGEYLHIRFEDTGIGITPENLPKIFDPYFTTKEMGCQKGMGLGLALCHSIVRHHHGLIEADSTPGSGTTVHIYLPVFSLQTVLHSNSSTLHG